MGDLKDPKWMYLKAILFLLIGVICFGLLFAGQPNLLTAVFLVLMTWAFCRAYYFVFYVITNYIDPNYKFSGLFDFVKYILRSRK